MSRQPEVENASPVVPPALETRTGPGTAPLAR
jgi:hypothetical protein